MGAKESKSELSLAEKRYRVGSLRGRKKKRSTVRKCPEFDDIAMARKSASDRSLAIPGANEGDPVPPHSHSLEEFSRLSAQMCSPAPSVFVGLPNGAELLNKNQRLLIEGSWKRSRKMGAENVGTKIFLLVLTAQPDIKMIFGLEKVPQGRLKYDPRFRKHALVFTRTFDYIIKNLSYTEKLAHHFQGLGKKHVLFQGRGFLPQYWDTFAECMTQTAIEWEGGQRCRETMVAWRILVSFIVKQMRAGFDDEKALRKRFSASLIGSTSVTPRTSFCVALTNDEQYPSTGTMVRKSNSFRSLSNNYGPTLQTPGYRANGGERSASWVAETDSFREEFSKLVVNRSGASVGCDLDFSARSQGFSSRLTSLRDDASPHGTEYYTPPSGRSRRSELTSLASSPKDSDVFRVCVYDENGDLADHASNV
ncbi:CBN-GLB-13 protein [Aphelenchoides avenae]|nr:CBN-GLB-13 protein [Aphelenchus avenae]